MRLTFLGTGPAAAIPRKGHRDALCVAARRGGKSARLRSSALLAARDGAVLIDAGPDIIAQIVSVPVRRLKAVLLTHAHADAAGGLGKLDRALAALGIVAPVPVYAPAAACARIRRRYGPFRVLQPRPVRLRTAFSVVGVPVTAFAVPHSATAGFPTCGYLFGRRLAYVSDAAHLPAKTRLLLRGVDTLVLDAAVFLGRRHPTHLSTDEALRISAACRARRVFLTQIGHSYPPHELAERTILHWVRAKRSEADRFPKSVRLAFDGLTTDI